jgi:MFS family permease
MPFQTNADTKKCSQGLGGGGIALMINIILTDLVPLRERGKYMAIVQMVSAVGAALGPFLGGLLTERSTWRWVFYINLPIGGSKWTTYNSPQTRVHGRLTHHLTPHSIAHRSVLLPACGLAAGGNLGGEAPPHRLCR